MDSDRKARLSNRLNRTPCWSQIRAVLVCFVSCLVCLSSACTNEFADPENTSRGPETANPELLNQDSSSTEPADAQETQSESVDAGTGDEIDNVTEANDEEPIPKTAETLLTRLDAGLETDQSSGLMSTEANKAIDILRKRYPFVSIRDRLSFQSQEPIGPPPPINVYNRNWDPSRSNRSKSLEALHSEEVQAFINRPGFGFDRGPRPNPYALKLDSEFAERLITRPVNSILLGESVVALPEYIEPESSDDKFSAIWSLTNGMPNAQLTMVFHSLTIRGFASSDSTGFVKNLDQVAGFQSHRIRHQKDWDGSLRIWNKEKLAKRNPRIKGLEITWRVNRLQLVSLLIHPTPRVYVSEKLPSMEELSGENAESRPLNDFEETGLERLKNGQQLVEIATPNRIVMLGAIRAEDSCLHCHAVEPDEILGAFSYELLREPRLELNGPAF